MKIFKIRNMQTFQDSEVEGEDFASAFPHGLPEFCYLLNEEDKDQRTLKQTIKDRLAVLDAQPDLTAAEVKEQVRKTFKLLKLRGLLD